MSSVYLRSPVVQSAAGEFRRRRSASGLLGDGMPGCVPAACKGHREQCRHPTRYQPGGSAVCGTSGNATSVRTLSASHRNPRIFDSLLSCIKVVSMPCQRVREKESHVSSSQHAVHLHSVPCLRRSMHFRNRFSPDYSRWWADHGVVPRYVAPLQFLTKNQST